MLGIHNNALLECLQQLFSFHLHNLNDNITHNLMGQLFSLGTYIHYTEKSSNLKKDHLIAYEELELYIQGI